VRTLRIEQLPGAGEPDAKELDINVAAFRNPRWRPDTYMPLAAMTQKVARERPQSSVWPS
jgi:hypothetical protein